MEDEDVFDIAQDVGVLFISINFNFGLDPHVWVGSSRVVPHVYHAVIQVHVESRYINIQAIESTEDDGFLNNISTPFVSKDIPDVFSNGCSHVGIHIITCFNLKVIQSRNGECNTDSFAWDDDRVILALGSFGHMPISYKYCLAPEVFHFHVKYHVTTNLLVTIQYTLSIRQNVKCNLHIIYLFVNCIGSQCVTILLINKMSLVNCIGWFSATLVSLLQISGMQFLNKRDNSVMLLEGMSHLLV